MNKLTHAKLASIIAPYMNKKAFVPMAQGGAPAGPAGGQAPGGAPPMPGGDPAAAGGGQPEIDPQSGLPIDPTTGLLMDPQTGMLIDPQTGTMIDPQSGQPVDPNTGMPTQSAAAGAMPPGEEGGAPAPDGGAEGGEPQEQGITIPFNDLTKVIETAVAAAITTTIAEELPKAVETIMKSIEPAIKANVASAEVKAPAPAPAPKPAEPAPTAPAPEAPAGGGMDMSAVTALTDAVNKLTTIIPQEI